MLSDWNTGKLLEISSSYWKGCTLQTAVRLEIFSHLDRDSLTSDEVADLAETDKRATELLLDALAAMKLLIKTDSRYSNTEFSEKYLQTQSRHYMGHIILHHHNILDGWAQLDKAVISGTPVEKRSYGEEFERRSFLMGMFNLAMGIAPEVARQLDLSDKKHLLDLGGGPGTYAIHFCLANPNLRATIFDRPTTGPFARKTVESFGLSDRIAFAGGDFNVDPIPGGPYDAAWLSHILHSNGINECHEIIGKTVNQLKSGGTILIHDFILDDSRDNPEFCALFSLNMLINNPRGRAYSESEIHSMLESAGVSTISRHCFIGPNDSSILIGVV